MILLGIDYGTRRIGLALGNTETRFAFPSATLEERRLFLLKIGEICKRENVEKIVIGLPQIWHGAQTLVEDIKRFGDTLQAHTGLLVEFVEEIFTSRLAEALSPVHAKHSVHAQSAALILENYFISKGKGQKAKVKTTTKLSS
jgi:putative Holliday junction resolvase